MRDTIKLYTDYQAEDWHTAVDEDGLPCLDFQLWDERTADWPEDYGFQYAPLDLQFTTEGFGAEEGVIVISDYKFLIDQTKITGIGHLHEDRIRELKEEIELLAEPIRSIMLENADQHENIDEVIKLYRHDDSYIAYSWWVERQKYFRMDLDGYETDNYDTLQQAVESLTQTNEEQL